MNRFVFLILLILPVYWFTGEKACAQESEMNDSIFSWNLYRKAVREFNENNTEEALQITERALQLAAALEDQVLTGNLYFLSGQCFEIREDWESALIYYIRASRSFERIDDPLQVIVLKKAAALFTRLNMYEKAAEYYQNALDFNLEQGIPFDAELVEDLAYSHFMALQFSPSEIRFRDLLEFAVAQQDQDLRLRTLFNLAEVTLKQEKLRDNLHYNQSMLIHFEEVNDKQAMALISNNMGYANLRLGDQSAALLSFLNALTYYEETEIEDKKRSQLLANIGICYQNLGEYDNSIRNLRQAINIVRTLEDTEETARLENIIANVYLLKRDLYNAGSFSLSSIESAKASGNKHTLVECYHTYSQVLKQGNDHIKALEYYELFLSLRDSLALEQRLYEQQLAQRILDLEKSEKELKLVLADEELKDLELRNLQIEAEKKEQELELLRRERALEVSERQRIMQSLELTRERHEAELRDREIQALSQEREIQELLIKQKEAEEKEKEKEIMLLENERELQQLEIERQEETRKRIIWMLFLLGAIVITMVVSFFVVRKKNQVLALQKQEIEEKNFDLEQKNEEIRAQSENLQTAYEEIQATNEMLEQKSEEILTQNEQITRQKELIEEKNKNITDSILYARRIQTAVLPPEDFIEGMFRESFLFYKPKDIVSGDFYWSAKKDRYRIIAAADCTGHGVPGAFMSMLGITLLNEVVIHTREFTAAQLLDRLRTEVIKSLKQKGVEGETKDGMDISLCVIDTEKMQADFAGANNPLYYFRNGELNILPADKMPIGISHQEVSELSNFTNHQIPVQAGDTLYLFTDGFSDQFGGPLNKKFKYNQFRKVLKEIHDLPMTVQKSRLEEVFENWRGMNEQIDDVLIIGLKI
jgi:serine phosphatase RsbU (regulator of sigma subunit)